MTAPALLAIHSLSGLLKAEDLDALRLVPTEGFAIVERVGDLRRRPRLVTIGRY